MKIITQWSTLICLSSTVCVILELIMPSGKMEKVLKVVLGLFIVVSLILPISNGIPKFNLRLKTEKINKKYTDSFVESLNKQFETLAQNNLKSVIEETLKEIGIKNEKIEIFMDTNQDNCISISKCNIYIPRDFKKSGSNSPLTSSEILEIKKELEKRLNIEIEIHMKD